AALRYARGEIGWLVRGGQARWIPYTVLYELTKLTGLVLGAQHEHLPNSVKRRLSAMPSYWETDSRTGAGDRGARAVR
ncbi:MAG: hypothetical protein ACLQBB_14080, partial [Solirubrobacteraceae bacterium]